MINSIIGKYTPNNTFYIRQGIPYITPLLIGPILPYKGWLVILSYMDINYTVNRVINSIIYINTSNYRLLN